MGNIQTYTVLHHQTLHVIIQRFLNQKKKNALLLLRNCRQCGVVERSRSHTTSVIPLSLCDKDIKSHTKSLQFSGVSTEADLILARYGIFERTESFSKMTVCPFHRSSLGIGWRRTSKYAVCHGQRPVTVRKRIKHHKQKLE